MLLLQPALVLGRGPPDGASGVLTLHLQTPSSAVGTGAPVGSCLGFCNWNPPPPSNPAQGLHQPGSVVEWSEHCSQSGLRYDCGLVSESLTDLDLSGPCLIRL